MSDRPARIVKCPQCRRALLWHTESRFRPFCSERCKLIDLGEWASEAHKIPGESIIDEDDYETYSSQ